METNGLPPGFELEGQSAPAPTSAPGLPPGFELEEQKYGGAIETGKAALEQGLSGATLGLSKVAETKLGITTPQAIAGREAAHPVISTLANIGGTAALLAGTGGLGAIAKNASVAGRIGLGALEGGLIGGVNQGTDDWSQDKALDGQRIAISAGLGALIGAAGTGLVEGIKAKFKPLTKAPGEVAPSAADAVPPGGPSDGGSPPGVFEAPPEVKGVQPATYQDIIDRVAKARSDGNALELPQKGQLSDALSRVGMENPVNPLQLDSLASQDARNVYRAAKETPGSAGQALSSYEGIQKNELVNKTFQAIQDVAPGAEPVADAVKGGKAAVSAFTEQYQAEKEALKPIFQNLKEIKLQGDLVADAIPRMVEAVPGIAEMFDASGSKVAVRPYRTSWGIDKSTYNAAKEAIESMIEAPNDFKSIWNIRKGLDQHIDVLAQGQAPNEIRAIKASIMQMMQDAAPSQGVREAFKRYAINEQQRAVIERVFGASVGSPEFGAISKVKPELIGDRIFGNTANVEAAKNILPKEQFNSILANWLAEAKTAATDNGAFSSNKFGSFMRRNQDALRVAFADNPAQLQRLNDLVTIMRILPDSASINPSGTAKTLMQMMNGLSLHNVTWEGLLATIPKKIATSIQDQIQLHQLNQALQGQSRSNAAVRALQGRAAGVTAKIDRGVKSLFSSSSSQGRKVK